MNTLVLRARAGRAVSGLAARLTGRRTLQLAVLALVAFSAGLLATNSAQAQSNVTGSLAGRAGPGATVTVINVETGYTRTTTASASGAFTLTAVPTGRYRVSATGEESEPLVEVSLGTTSSVRFGGDAVVELERLEVSGLGASFSPIDFGRTESVAIFNAAQLDALPVERNTSAIALLAAGTVPGDTAFGNLVSFGGASVAENAYFVDGFNLSDFRTGTNPIQLPYEAYEQFEIKSGGYSAEFGRSLGGVINATTRTGTNTYKAGANVFYLPDSGLNGKTPNVYYTNQLGTPDTLWRYNGADKRERLEANIWASGPLIKDKLFFYGLYNANEVKNQDVLNSGDRIRRQKQDDPLYLAKLTANPFPGHTLEYTFIGTEKESLNTDTDYDFATHTDQGTNLSTITTKRGGDIHIARYIGSLTDRLTFSALWGTGKNNLSTVGSTDLEPLVLDARFGPAQRLSGTQAVIEPGSVDEREVLRFDLTYGFSLLGEHQLRVGFDREDNSSAVTTGYSGGGWYYLYMTVTPGASLGGGTVPAGVTQVTRDRFLENSGSFEVTSDAYYIEDNWSTLDGRLLLRLGVRSENFENFNAAGESFVKMTEQIAPRLGVAYDLLGDQKTKVYANYGRYHIPVASNTNARLAGGETFTEEHYELLGVNPDGTPIRGQQIGSLQLLSPGGIPNKDTIVDRNLDPMYQDEFIVGIDHALNKDYRIGLRATYRDLKSTMDDMIIDHALTDYAQNVLGIAGADFIGYQHYVLANPGKSITTLWDFEDGNGEQLVTLTPEQLKFTEGKRKYAAVELLFEKVWDGKWAAQFSYTWSQNYGNTEGWVYSDIGQDDAGLTQQFDTPDLQRNSFGWLPNDRRHAFKLFGHYALTSELTLGANFRLTSGRPLNYKGWYNDAVTGTGYGADYYLVQRGHAGRMGWVFEQGISLRYVPKWAGRRLALQVDVNNLLNRRTVTQRVEIAEIDTTGTAAADYLLPTAWQTPRRVTFSASYGF
ncbi:hypothetical protein AXK11_01605 [Cephaloticoccus primus]|uniref:TonB-dependent receptor plug domain-containing protein n=1 Tax=Cephaloticoccus primus TaxID=1548207 RepID=A0A139STH9_9BACT|nr:TonB-dependent receptor [Cephaloticoccus primus]KXU37875.1 hypothetical protein AXK11_01605 [Cephaloticoccus primus]